MKLMASPTLFLATPGELTGSQMFIRLSLFILVGAIFFIAGVAGQSNGKAKPWVKYLAIIPPAMGVVWGMDYFRYATDQFVKKSGMIGGNSEKFYVAAPWICLAMVILTVLGCVIADRRFRILREEV